ncbi:MAG: ABC transporter ATP-binding protein [Lachnospiraceae bacterium]|nr:ABC transporter ATP-binding protein [Lachnospiraceae bacterium]
MEDLILEAKHICKYFGSLTANDDVSLRVRRGTVHSVIGENGAGKSTLMNIISGIYKPDRGEIYVKGNPVVFRNPNDATKCGIGMVHQEFMLFPELTVLENLMMGFETKKYGGFLDKKKAAKDITEIAEKYGFSIPLEKRVAELPVSLLQQVEIVKVLYKGAEIIILDEPTSVLTPQGIEGLFRAIRYLTRQGKTVILITHKLKEVMEISDDITVLKNGVVTGNLRPEETDEHGLANLMVGRQVLFNTKKPKKQIGEAILTVEHLTAPGSDGTKKVKDVSFCVRKGEILGIAGVAGSGQGELIEAVFGLRTPSGGAITYKGEDITASTPRQKREKRIGYVPQDRISTGCNVNGSLIENCIMGYHVAHKFKIPWLVDREEAAAFTGDVVANYQVKVQDIHNKIGTLSGGNIQKTIVGREFAQNNDLLIIEDPTRGIDVGAIEFIWQKIIDAAAQGVSVLLVSHELGEVMELSDRILVMYNGGIAADLENTPELDEKTIGLYMLGGKA